MVGTASGSRSCATITATIQFRRIRAKKLYLYIEYQERSRAATHQKPADQTTKSPNSSDCCVRSPGVGGIQIRARRAHSRAAVFAARQHRVLPARPVDTDQMDRAGAKPGPGHLRPPTSNPDHPARLTNWLTASGDGMPATTGHRSGADAQSLPEPASMTVTLTAGSDNPATKPRGQPITATSTDHNAGAAPVR